MVDLVDMVDPVDIDRFQELYRQLKTMNSVDTKGKLTVDQCVHLIPSGTKQTFKKSGAIGWLDPITKRAISFHDLNARNAWILLQCEKGVFATPTNN
jgi:hypothetical protein